MGQPAAKQGDQVMATDIHIEMVPTPGGPVPTPLPDPFTGMLDGGLSGDVQIQGKAAAVVGELRDADGRVALEQQLATDSDPVVRRNAAWALGRIGDEASRDVLTVAKDDPSSLVRLTARAAIYKLR